jgi:lycopene cyclase domain-containing protein
MREYLLIAVILLVLMFFIDRKLKTGLFKSRLTLYTLTFLILIQAVFDQIVILSELVQYREVYITGFRIGVMPIEDFLFGITLYLWTFILWEKLGSVLWKWPRQNLERK